MVRPLNYDTKLTLEEATERYKEVKEVFTKVKGHYEKKRFIFGKHISDEDKKTLTDCFGVLLPLSMKDPVQEEIGKREKLEDTLHYQIANLQSQIMFYLSEFKNTGVKRFEGSLNLE